ncbi:hypothetical protein EV127DRAFT_435962 [Xylaria flabelliformis]|nr:hypothetical protein EV127DRAFT_435962 [Xylaria flabelliformis]
MPSAHDTFKALGPVEWESFAQEDLAKLMTDIFSDAHCLIDSIPAPAVDAGPMPSRATEPSDHAQQLRKEWKEVKVNARDNPLGLGIYKMAAKDGKGAWFARRSTHDGPSFEKWKRGMEREFAESLKVQGHPGDGKIRGLGADKRVEDQTVEACGNIQVYQLSAQFPGPTAPRDFVTLCLSSDTTTSGSRSYMLVSRPCVHPDCPQRQGFVRGYYESVEFIREVKIHKSRPSIDAASQDPSTKSGSNSVGEDPATSASPSNGQGDGSKSNGEDNQDEGDSIIEWLMITRSDPGGSVPRFIIEKKTPEGIATDAGKFFQWISSEKFEKLLNSNFESIETSVESKDNVASTASTSGAPSKSVPTPPAGPKVLSRSEIDEPDFPESPGAGGVYGMISGALGMVASAAASRLLGPSGEYASESESEISSPDLQDDSSSIHSFHSLDPTADAELAAKVAEGEEPAPSISTGTGGDSLHSSESTSVRSPQLDKELKKLEERRRKTEEKLRRAEERALAKKSDDTQRDQLALQKLQEKHEREVAKQEEKYQRERRKLEAKRASEEKKAEERRRKQAEREQKANLALELEKTRAERDIARKEVEILAEQVRELQALNTKLVARLGREGISLDDVTTPSSGSGGVTPGILSRSVTEQDLVKQSNGVKS